MAYSDDVVLPGHGDTVATDVVGARHFQRIKLDIGEDGATSPVTERNPLPIRADHETAYGEIFTASAKPVIQASPTYNMIPANWRTFTALGGSAACADKAFVCQTGTSQGAYGTIRSVRSVNYHPGVASIGRFEGKFSAGVAGSQQGIGFFNVGDGFLFGYQGASFGIIHQYGGKPEVRTVTVTVGAGGAETLTLTLNTVNYSIPITAGTTAHNAFEIAAWLEANQSVWRAEQIDSTVIISAQSDGAKSGTYTYSTNGTGAGSIAQTTAGATKTEDFIAQSSWNVDTLGEIDPTKWQNYAIQFHGLRAGIVEFFVMDPDTGREIPVHRITAVNNGAALLTNNSSMRIGVYCYNSTNTTNVATYAGTMAAFHSGEVDLIRNPRSYSNSKTITTTLTSVFSIRNALTYNGEPNQVEIQLMRLKMFAVTTTKGVRVKIVGNATLGNETNFTRLAGNLVTEVSTDETTVTGGIPIIDERFYQDDAIDLMPYKIRIPPGITMTVAMSVETGGGSTECGAGVTLYEDV